MTFLVWVYSKLIVTGLNFFRVIYSSENITSIVIHMHTHTSKVLCISLELIEIRVSIECWLKYPRLSTKKERRNTSDTQYFITNFIINEVAFSKWYTIILLLHISTGFTCNFGILLLITTYHLEYYEFGFEILYDFSDYLSINLSKQIVT